MEHECQKEKMLQTRICIVNIVQNFYSVEKRKIDICFELRHRFNSYNIRSVVWYLISKIKQ